MNRLRLSVILAVLTLFGCEDSRPASPACRFEPQVIPQGSQAKCLIRVENSILLIKLKGPDKLILPGGTVDPEENLACAAHRHTWQQTGLNVVVEKPLGKLVDGSALFRCTEQAGLAQLGPVIEAPAWAQDNISTLELHNPFQLTHQQLQQPDNLVRIRDGFVQP